MTRPRRLACLFLLTGLLATSGGVLPASAQSLKFGLQAGGNFASFRGETGALTETENEESSAELGRRTAFQAGAFVEIGINDWLSVRPELSYVRKGTTIDATLRATNPQTGEVQTFAELDGTLRLSYLELPVLAKLQLPTTGRFAPSLFVGPSFGVNLTSESRTEVRSQVDEINDETRTEDVDTADTEFGAVIGGEVAYTLSSGHAVSLDVRYSTGFTDASPGDVDAPVQNEVVSVGVGYTFSF